MANLQDFLQSMSNSAASNVSAPVDGINWLLRKAGLPVSDEPVLGSDWLAKNGYTRPVEQNAASLAGETAAMLAPFGMAAKAPQVARGLLQAGENVAAPSVLNKQAGVYLVHTPTKPNSAVGSRFDTEFVGNMSPKTPRRIEDLQGSSLLAMPWDSTSRGYSVKSISDELLPNPVLTTGGQDFARDLAHINSNVAGASGGDIAKRIQDRVRIATKENQHFGGNGSVYSLPTTMGAGGENFSTMPTEALLGLLQKQDLAPSQINTINEWIRNSPIIKSKKLVRPFQNFAGVDTDAGLLQFITGEGIDTTAGELRKAFANEMGKVRGQQMLNYNSEDLVGALTDPALRGVGKGYAGNTVIRSDPHGSLTPSDHPSYDTNFPGQYFGSLLNNIPIEHLMPKTYRSLAEEMAGRQGSLRNNVIGAMEKRKAGISEIVDQQVIDSVNQYLGR